MAFICNATLIHALERRKTNNLIQKKNSIRVGELKIVQGTCN